LTSLIHTEDFHEWSEQEIQEQLLMDEELVSGYNPDWISPTLSLKSIASITQGMKNFTIRARGERQNTLFGPDNNKEKQPASSPTSQEPQPAMDLQIQQFKNKLQAKVMPLSSSATDNNNTFPLCNHTTQDPGYTTQHQPHLHSQPPFISLGIQPQDRPGIVMGMQV
jgi:hypothetical protein